MQLTQAQVKVYRKSAREREAAQRRGLEARRQRAWEMARRAASILKEEFGASRVVVFGSLLDADLFHWRSDVDLAVWDVQRYYRAVSRLLDLEPEIGFDLVPIDDARPGLRAMIEREGVDL